MRALNQKIALRPRELRRRVILPARLWLDSRWTDTCILNVSTRGLMIQTAQPAQPGAIVEIRRDLHVITARVMWREGGKLGLESEGRVPVEEILSIGASKSLRLVATEGALVERRQAPRRSAPDARHLGRTLQFVGVLVFAATLSITGIFWIRATLARPLVAAEAALSS